MAQKKLSSPRAGSRSEAALHGNAPDKSDVALVLVDVVNDFTFPGGDRLARRSRQLASRLAAVKARARRAGIPCVYANDNFGRWRSDFSAQVRHCMEDGVPGAFLAEALRPDTEDYFVLKPKHSAFYETCLEVLLSHLGARTLVVAGIATDNCVLFTAADAFLRGHQLVILEDGCAAMTDRAHRQALDHMVRTLKARRASCASITFAGGARGTSVRLKKKR